MCFNKEISLTTFIVASIISILFYLRNKPNDRLIAIFNFSIGLMQLAEYFIWLNINNKEKNKFYTRIAKLIYSLHPIVILFAFYFLGSLNINKSILVYPIIFGLFYTIYLIINVFTDYNLTTISKINKHLSWNGKNYSNFLTLIHYIYYGSVIILLPLLIKPFKNGIIFFSLISITALFSYLKTRNELSFNDKESWKSLWCNIGNICAIIFYIYTSYIQKK